MATKQNQQLRSSISVAASLLSACLVTLMSIFAGHEPETVLFRAIVGGVIIGIVATILSSFATTVLAEQDEDF